MSSAHPRNKTQNTPTLYDEDTLNSLTTPKLIAICKDHKIPIKKGLGRSEIIAIILGNPGDSAEASARSDSASFSHVRTAKPNPSPSATASARQAVFESGQIEASVFASLTHGSIAGMSAPDANAKRKKQWDAIYVTGHQPWDNPEYLQRGVLTRMMPENPEYVDEPLFVVNIGAAGVGKSNGPFALGLGCNNTLVLNPDEWYEFFAIMFGYKPPLEDSQWWTEHRVEFGQYEDVIPSEDITRDTTRPVASEFCSPKVHCMTAYSNMLKTVKDFIFEQALGVYSLEMYSKSTPRGLNIVFDSTGSMETVIDEYITMAKEFGYKIAIVGVYSTLKNCIGRVDQDALLPWKFDSEEAAANTSADLWRPMSEAQIVTRPDIPPAVAGGAAAGAVSCRNKLQHRKLVAGGLKSAWDAVLDKAVIFNWVTKAQAQENLWRIVLVENNLSSANPYGNVGIIYDNGGRELFVQQKVDDSPATVSALFRPTGFYGMKLDAGGTFVGRDEVIREAAVKAAAAKAKAAAAKAAASKRGDRGGSSRKRRISRRRIHGSRARKTIKKYSRHVTRRHRHCHH